MADSYYNHGCKQLSRPIVVTMLIVIPDWWQFATELLMTMVVYVQLWLCITSIIYGCSYSTSVLCGFHNYMFVFMSLWSNYGCLYVTMINYSCYHFWITFHNSSTALYKHGSYFFTDLSWFRLLLGISPSLLMFLITLLFIDTNHCYFSYL